MIDQYFNALENLLNDTDPIKRIDIQKQKLNESFGIIKGKAHFENGILEFLEVVSSMNSKGVKRKNTNITSGNSTILWFSDTTTYHITHNYKPFPTTSILKTI